MERVLSDREETAIAREGDKIEFYKPRHCIELFLEGIISVTSLRHCPGLNPITKTCVYRRAFSEQLTIRNKPSFITWTSKAFPPELCDIINTYTSELIFSNHWEFEDACRIA